MHRLLALTLFTSALTACAEPEPQPLRRSMFIPALKAPKDSQPPPEPSEARTRSRFSRHEGARVFFLDQDDRADTADATAARTFLLVHGWACDHLFFREQIPVLAAQGRCLAADLPGHGRSDPPAADLTLASMAESLLAVLDEAGVERAILVGHSNGVPVALEFARRHPDRVSGLVALDGALRPMFTDPQIRLAMTARFRGLDYRDEMRATFENMLPEALGPSLRKQLIAAACSTPKSVALASMEAANDPEQWSEGRVQVPLLAVHAPSSYWSGDYEDFVRGLSPATSYHVLPGASHMMILEEPARVHELIEAWLTESTL